MNAIEIAREFTSVPTASEGEAMSIMMMRLHHDHNLKVVNSFVYRDDDGQRLITRFSVPEFDDPDDEYHVLGLAKYIVKMGVLNYQSLTWGIEPALVKLSGGAIIGRSYIKDGLCTVFTVSNSGSVATVLVQFYENADGQRGWRTEHDASYVYRESAEDAIASAIIRLILWLDVA
jgi:hypothetical protein